MALALRLTKQAGYRERWIATMTNGLRLSRDQNDWPVHAELSLRIGQLYRLMSRFTEAETHLLSSVQSFAELGDTTKQAQALNQLAYLACFRHQYDHSEQLTKQALALVNDQSLTTAMSFSALGLVAISADNIRQRSLIMNRRFKSVQPTTPIAKSLGVYKISAIHCAVKANLPPPRKTLKKH
ncbi:MAG: tetratricopeptide repeat protein [Caldilineaceae bacterium]